MQDFTFSLTADSSPSSPLWKVTAYTLDEAWQAISTIKALPIEQLKTFITINTIHNATKQSN